MAADSAPKFAHSYYPSSTQSYPAPQATYIIFAEHAFASIISADQLINDYPPQYYYHQAPPAVVQPPPQYYPYQAPPSRNPGFLEGCLAALCCCCLVDECCIDLGCLFC